MYVISLKTFLTSFLFKSRTSKLSKLKVGNSFDRADKIARLLNLCMVNISGFFTHLGCNGRHKRSRSDNLDFYCAFRYHRFSIWLLRGTYWIGNGCVIVSKQFITVMDYDEAGLCILYVSSDNLRNRIISGIPLSATNWKLKTVDLDNVHLSTYQPINKNARGKSPRE